MSIFLETKRLILKTPDLSDLDNLIILRSDPDAMKYTGDDVQKKEEVKEILDFFISYYDKYGMGFFSVFEKETNSFVGQAGLFHLLFDDTKSEIEIAYRLHKKFWGKGYATELAKAIIQWGFQHLSKDKLIASAYPDNISSQKVLKKAGFDFSRKIKLEDGTELFRYEIYKNDSIELVTYDNQWPVLAKLEIKALFDVLPKNNLIDIQHVGSTAVPGMLSKPIIDIQIAVDSLKAIKPIAIDELKKLGYEYWHENPDPERMFFVKGMPPFGERRTHHVHIVEPTSKHWAGKIAFRDYLISYPQAAKEYEQLKIELAQQHTFDREEYTNAKTQFVNDILQKSNVCMSVNNTVKTVELLLRRPTVSDALILRGLWQNEKVREFLGGVVSSEIIDEKLASLQKHWNQHGFGQWSVVHKSNDQVIGLCGLHHSEDGIELSYMFFPALWGKGLATEAALASLNYGFNVLNVDKIIAITQESSYSSCRLLEKIGMQCIDKFSRFNAIQCLYQLIQKEWNIKNG
jgi:RimJ/RimL family protein N-acetyltransferase